MFVVRRKGEKEIDCSERAGNCVDLGDLCAAEGCFYILFFSLLLCLLLQIALCHNRSTLWLFDCLKRISSSNRLVPCSLKLPDKKYQTVVRLPSPARLLSNEKGKPPALRSQKPNRSLPSSTAIDRSLSSRPIRAPEACCKCPRSPIRHRVGCEPTAAFTQTSLSPRDLRTPSFPLV